MDYKNIEWLLKRYWQCETSLEEEETLRNFFVEEDVPAHLAHYKHLFVYQKAQREVGLGDEFDERVLAAMETPIVEAKHLTWTNRLIPLFKAVAAVAVVLILGNVAQHSFVEEEGSVLATDTIGKQVTAPSVAISNDVRGEQTFGDSLLKAERNMEIINE